MFALSMRINNDPNDTYYTHVLRIDPLAVSRAMGEPILSYIEVKCRPDNNTHDSKELQNAVERAKKHFAFAELFADMLRGEIVKAKEAEEESSK